MKTGLFAAFDFWLVYTVLYMYYTRIRGVRSEVRRAQLSVALDHGRRAPSPHAPDTVCGAGRLYPRPQGPTCVRHYAGKTARVGTAGSGNVQLTPRIHEDAAVKGRRQN